jgi:hypothetical protein
MLEVQDIVEFEAEEFIAQREEGDCAGTFHDACENHRQTFPLPLGTRLESRGVKSATCANTWTAWP